jgi:hypothetical protein
VSVSVGLSLSLSLYYDGCSIFINKPAGIEGSSIKYFNENGEIFHLKELCDRTQLALKSRI